jgi:hypothetical protein
MTGGAGDTLLPVDVMFEKCGRLVTQRFVADETLVSGVHRAAADQTADNKNRPQGWPTSPGHSSHPRIVKTIMYITINRPR